MMERIRAVEDTRIWERRGLRAQSTPLHPREGLGEGVVLTPLHPREGLGEGEFIEDFTPLPTSSEVRGVLG